MLPLATPIDEIKLISPALRQRLQKLGIKTLRDIFYHFPFRYDDFSIIKPIGQLKLNEIATIHGQIIEIKNTRTWKKRMFVTEAYVQDKSGIIKAAWFNQPYLANTLKQNNMVSLAGKVSFDKELYLSNPAYEKIHTRYKIQDTKYLSLCHTGRLVAVYPETAGVSSRWLRYIIKTFLPALPQIKDHLPLEIKRGQNLLDLQSAIEQIHFPKTKKHAEAARRRLAFDELFLIQLSSLQQKIRWQKNNAPKIPFNQKLVKEFVDSLPFKLTDAQRKSAWEILQNLDQPKPMNRLLEGDVGSGKTAVAAIAILEIVKAGWQAAFMAPTEILAQQHFKTIINLLAGQNITIGLLTGSEALISSRFGLRPHSNNKYGVDDYSSSEAPLRRGGVEKLSKSDFLEQTSSGQVQILIGTHALIQENVKFKNLALVVLDEQHRFGVAQRAALQKNITLLDDGQIQTIPHLLSMTATPIPRTLALTIYGDLDISLLDQMPKGRKEIITKIVAPGQRAQAYEFIRQQVKQGRQVFVICPRIESKAFNGNEARIVESQAPDVTALRNGHRNRLTLNDRQSATWDEVKAVKEEYEKLDKIIFPDLKIAMLHGKLKPKEKEKIMADFSAKGGSPPDGRAGASGGKAKIDILISTSVVEVGVDVPNASIMMIEGAERFGLAQLHQFRGRVGRAEHQSYCFLFTTSGSSNARLEALTTSKSGFELAEKDLAIRGPGEFYGTRQWGLPDLSMASLSDIALVKASRDEAQKLIQNDPELKKYPLLKEKLGQFQSAIHLE